MKKIFFGLLILTHPLVFSQTFTEKITKEFSFEKRSADNALIVANISGHIKVSGYEGDKVLVELTRTIKAKTDERLTKGKAQIRLGVIDRADTLILYTDGLCSKFGKSSKKNGDWQYRNGWGYRWNDREDEACKELCDHTFNYVIKVPYSVNVLVSTVNEGKVEVENVKGSIVANNVNGGIILSNISREATAHTINGDLEITYTKNPDKPCRFYTLNGDINAWFQKGLAATMNFESFNGELFTNLPKLEAIPLAVEKKVTDRGTKFNIKGNRFKIGEGGALLDFETFNGNVYIKEKI